MFDWFSKFLPLTRQDGEKIMATQQELQDQVTAVKTSLDAQVARTDSLVQTMKDQAAALQAQIDALEANAGTVDQSVIDSLKSIQAELDAESAAGSTPPAGGGGETPIGS